MNLTISEADNLLSMLNSNDKDNMYIAFKAIEAHDFSGPDFGYLIYLYKFSNTSIQDWSENAPTPLNKLKKSCNNELPTLTHAKSITLLIENEANPDVINAYIEKHIKDINSMFYNMGYPMENIDLTLNLKTNE